MQDDNKNPNTEYKEAWKIQEWLNYDLFEKNTAMGQCCDIRKCKRRPNAWNGFEKQRVWDANLHWQIASDLFVFVSSPRHHPGWGSGKRFQECYVPFGPWTGHVSSFAKGDSLPVLRFIAGRISADDSEVSSADLIVTSRHYFSRYCASSLLRKLSLAMEFPKNAGLRSSKSALRERNFRWMTQERESPAKPMTL